MPNRQKKEAMRIVARYGTMWARNETNITKALKSRKHIFGVYILFDGSMPMYVGKGEMSKRVRKAAESTRRGQRCDRFSWYAIKNPRLLHDIEAIMLRVLPPN